MTVKRYNFTKDPERTGEDAISVGRTSRKRIDIVPRVICFIIALLIWIYMVNLNDTDVTATVTLQIDVVGTDVLRAEDNMLIYGIDKNTVTITVKGSNRDLKKYTEADYRATVDVSGLTNRGQHDLPIKIETPIDSSITVVSTEPSSVRLYSDYSLTKNVKFEVLRGNMTTVPTYVYSIEQSSDTIEITGPGSIVELIDSAKYRVEGEFYSSKSFSDFTLMFYDKNGDFVSTDSGTVAYSTSDVVVKVNVSTHKSIPIVVEVEGAGADLVPVPQRSYVTVHGDPTLIAQISEYKITLSEAVVGRVAEVTLTGDNLPEGITIEGEGDVITVQFESVLDESETGDE